jgi:predicted transposase/invertase (TIGR01784 family)
MLYLPLKMDFVFKYVFTNDLGALASLISSILFPGGDKRVEVIEIISSEIIPIFKNGKRTFLDLKLLCKILPSEEDNLIQIELQVAEQTGYIQRSLYYATGLIQHQLKVGESYFQLTPIIQINILDFSLLPDENIVSRYLLKEFDSNKILTEDFQMIYVELPKFQKTEIEGLHTEAEIWFYLLKNIQDLTEESRMEILKKKPDLKNAFGVLEMYSSDPEKQREFEERLRADENYAYELAVRYEKGIEKGFEKGIEEGIEKGEFRKSLETARKMKDKKFSSDEIMDITGLSEDDLRKNGIL